VRFGCPASVHDESRFFRWRSGSESYPRIKHLPLLKAGAWPRVERAVFSPRRLELGFEFDESLERFEKIPERAGRKHDRVTPAAHVFSDF
jgi:hypothetical protein